MITDERLEVIISEGPGSRLYERERYELACEVKLTRWQAEMAFARKRGEALRGTNLQSK